MKAEPAMSKPLEELNSNELNDFRGFRKFLDIIDRRFEEVLVVAGFLLFILLINAQVINRYLLPFIDVGNITTWTEELSRYIFVFVSFLGASLAIRKRESIEVTFIVERFSPMFQNSIRIANSVFMVYFSFLMLKYGVELIGFQFETYQTSPALNLPMSVPYSAVPIGFGLIIIRLIQQLYYDTKNASYKEGLLAVVVSIAVVLPLMLASDGSVPLILFGYFALFIMIGMPIAFTLGISTLATVFATGAIPIDFFPQTAFTSIDNFPIMAVPLFIAAGIIMGSGNIIKKLLNLSDELLGFLPGGLALVTVFTSMFFSAISGSGPATVAAIGSILIPAMIKQGYNAGFATALVATAGSIGVIIPPSNPLVIYGVIGQESISKLFMAGIIPGVLTGIALLIVSFVVSKRNGWQGTKTKFDMKTTLKATWDAKLALLVPIIILGGIYGGIMTPTEAAAVAAGYGLIIGLFVYKDLNMKKLYKNLSQAGVTSSIIIMLIIMASIFGRLITLDRIAEMVASFVLTISDNKIIILLLLNIFLLFVGLIMEALAAIVILTPILLPVAVAIGIDPIHFGLIMIFNLAIGFITPPVGVNLFVAASTAKLKIEEVIKGNTVLLITMIIVLGLVTFIPQLSLWMANLIQ